MADAAGHFQFNQPRQERDVVQPFCRSLLGQFAMFPQDSRQPQGFETRVRKDLMVQKD